jgi:hypothetical protein
MNYIAMFKMDIKMVLSSLDLRNTYFTGGSAEMELQTVTFPVNVFHTKVY